MSLLPLFSSSAFGATVQDSLNILIDLDQSSLGPTPKQVSRAVRHLCGLLLPGDELKPLSSDDFYRVAHEYYKNRVETDRSGRNRLTFLAYVSGFFHEVRHAHDLLATSYGQELLFTVLNYYQNTPSLLQFLSDWLGEDERRRVPLPLGRNLDRFPRLPNQLKALIASFLARRADIKAFQEPKRRSPADLTITHLLEGSAVDIQLDFVYDVFGAEGLFLLSEFVQGGKRSRVYLQIREELSEIFHGGKFRGRGLGGVIDYLVWCSLMGTTPQGKKLDDGPNPVLLFEALAQHVARNAEASEFETIHKVVREFYQRWTFLTPEEVVERIVQRVSNRLKRYDELAKEGQTARLFYNAYKALGSAFAKMNEQIRKSPEIYFGQRAYVWSFLGGALPSVKVTAKIDGTAQDFMTRGYQIVSPDDWILVATFSSAFRMLVEGRDLSPFSFFDDICFRTLAEGAGHGAPLRFEDKGPLFDWQ